MPKNNPSKKKRKFRLILDSAFANIKSFPKLVDKANLTHIVHTYGFPPSCSDEEIYQKGITEDRFILTINFKHFRKLVKAGRPGIIGIESQLTNEQIDKLVSDFVSRNDPKNFLGKAIKL